MVFSTAFHPLDSALGDFWEHMVEAANSTSVKYSVVINPASGPGEEAIDDYTQGIYRLWNAGIEVRLCMNLEPLALHFCALEDSCGRASSFLFHRRSWSSESKENGSRCNPTSEAEHPIPLRYNENMAGRTATSPIKEALSVTRSDMNQKVFLTFPPTFTYPPPFTRISSPPGYLGALLCSYWIWGNGDRQCNSGHRQVPRALP